MVKITKLNDVEMILNADLIETLEATPDTVIALTNGKKLMVKENIEDIVKRVIEYRQSIFRMVQVVNTEDG